MVSEASRTTSHCPINCSQSPEALPNSRSSTPSSSSDPIRNQALRSANMAPPRKKGDAHRTPPVFPSPLVGEGYEALAATPPRRRWLRGDQEDRKSVV